MNFRTLDLNLLRVFDEVMSERNLTRAARNLSMTQPAVSNALRRLREALDDELFARAGHGVEPTPRALALWPAVREAMSSLRAALTPAIKDIASVSARYVVAMADSTAIELLPPLVGILQTVAPGVVLETHPLLSRDPREELEAGLIDLAVGHFPGAVAAITTRGMELGKVSTFGVAHGFEGRYICVMRADHPMAEGELTLDRYCAARHLLVSFNGRPFGFVDQALAELKRTRNVVLTVNQFTTACEVALHTDLLAVVPELFFSHVRMGGRLVSRPVPLPVPAVHVDLIWHREREDDPVHQWMRDAVLQAGRMAVSPRDA